MKVNATLNNLIKIAVVLLAIFTTAGMAFGTDSPGRKIKQTSAKQAGNEWKKVVEAAKQEGKIVISGMIGEEWRRSQVEMFQQEYPEIAVELSTAAGRNFGARLRQEREMGKKLWDLRSSGGVETTLEAKDNGYLTPIRPLLLPEIADDGRWIGGIDESFSDREKKYIFSYILYISPSIYVNRDFIKEPDLKSALQILDPKFKGKIVMLPPTGGVSVQSLGHLAFTYGEKFVRELLSKQDVTIADDNRQHVEWVVRGKYPISIGFNRTLLIPFHKQGLGKNVLGLEDKIVQVSTGSGNVCILEGAPHPNAARVYINWLLSQKTQTMLSKNIQQNSRRTDVTPVDRETAVVKSIKYRNSSSEEVKEYATSLFPLIKDALKK